MKILDSNLQVKLNLTKNFTKELLLTRALYGVATDEIIKPSAYFPGLYSFSGVGAENVAGCPLSVPASLAVTAKSPEKKEPSPEKKQKKQKWFFIAQSRNPTDGELQAWANERLDDSGLVFKKTLENQQYVFLGSLKGNPTYAKKSATRIRQCAELLDARYKYKYFITLTFKADLQHGDRVEAWQSFSSQMLRFNKELSRSLRGKYLMVLESTFNGFPHAHCVFYTNDLVDEKHMNYDKATTIRGGFMFDWVKAHSPAPVFNLQFAADNNTVHYLAKYISKTSYADIRKIPERKNKKAYKTWRKNLLSLFMPVVANVRSVRTSERLDEIPTLEELARAEKSSVSESSFITARTIWREGQEVMPNFTYIFADPENDADCLRKIELLQMLNKRIARGKNPSLERGALDWLLNNLPKKCYGSCRIGFGKHVHDKFGHLVDSPDPPTKQEAQDFERCSYPVGCQDCIVKRLLRRRLGEDVSLTEGLPHFAKTPAVSDAEPMPESRDKATLEREIKAKAKAFWESEFYRRGFNIAWNELFAKIEPWTSANNKAASEKFKDLDLRFGLEDEKEKAIKANLMEHAHYTPNYKALRAVNYVVELYGVKTQWETSKETPFYVVEKKAENTASGVYYDVSYEYSEGTRFETFGEAKEIAENMKAVFGDSVTYEIVRPSAIYDAYPSDEALRGFFKKIQGLGETGCSVAP